MRSGNASRHERLTQLFERNIIAGRAAGLLRIRVEDDLLEGGWLTIRGQRMLNFGSAAYMGLNVDSRLKQGAIKAVERFGPVFSSSAAYTSIDLYSALEHQLTQVFGAHVVIPTTTTLGHLGALPVLVGAGDAVFVDAQAHSTVHLATQILMAEGIPVTPVPHNDVNALTTAVAEGASLYRRIWYLADGVYSMLGDVAPFAAIRELLDTFENLHVYIDDAHGFSWVGARGQGLAREKMGLHPRVVLVASLAKSFGAGGAVIAFPTELDAQRVQLAGGTMTFSGPLHPAELGAAVASAEIHLSDEIDDRQMRLAQQIAFVTSLLEDSGLPIAQSGRTPLWFLRVGGNRQTMELARRMMADGFYLNYACFPAVPAGQSGLRFTHTLYQSNDQISDMINRLVYHYGAMVVEGSEIVDLTEDLTIDLGERSLVE